MLSLIQFKKAVREITEQVAPELDIPVIVDPESKTKSPDLPDVYTMGEYLEMRFPDDSYAFEPKYKPSGQHIKIYYGSFVKNCLFLSDEELLEKIKEVIEHELIHYGYSKRGEKDLLAVQDEIDIYQIKTQKGLLTLIERYPAFLPIVFMLAACILLLLVSWIGYLITKR